MLDNRTGPIAPGEAIVKVMYNSQPPPPITPEGDPSDWYCGDDTERAGQEMPIGYAVMVKTDEVNWDDWFWSIYFINSDMPGMAPLGTNGYGFCMTCHGSAVSEMTFSDTKKWTEKPGDNYEYWYWPIPEAWWANDDSAEHNVPFDGPLQPAREFPLDQPDNAFLK